MYFTVTIDTEEEWDWSDWPTERPRVSNIQSLPRFQEQCARHGVRPTYFVNQAVLNDEDARRIVLDFSRCDDVEIGMHIHPWNTPPIDELAPVRARESFLHNLPDEIIDAKLSHVYDGFREHGLTPTSFRGGRYSSGGRIIDFLRGRGFWVDASALPHTTWPEDGAPDYRRRDLWPRRLAPSDSERPPLWEIPLTLGFTRQPQQLWRRLHEAVETTWLGKLRLIGIAERLGLVRKVWLNFESPLGERMLDFLPVARRLGLPCVCFTVHSSSLVAGPGPYTRDAADEARITAQIEDVFHRLADADDLTPVTMTQLAKILEKQYHAHSGN